MTPDTLQLAAGLFITIPIFLMDSFFCWLLFRCANYFQLFSSERFFKCPRLSKKLLTMAEPDQVQIDGRIQRKNTSLIEDLVATAETV
jgi:hypothetical protein